MSSNLTWDAGHVIGGRYRLIEPLGRGGMGEVWRAEHTTLRAPVAVKLIDPKLLEPSKGMRRDDVLKRFLHEAQAAAALRSPHVVQILDHGVDDGVPYMTMELLEGETLADRLDRVRVLPLEQTARILTHVGRALGKAHEAGIIHRDLKPENVFIVRNDEEDIAKVLDFGVAKMTGALVDLEAGALVTRSGFMVGTPCYMSPEQAQGKKDLDGRSDLWAMAAIAFECVCGRRPFESDAVGTLVLQICAHDLPVPSTIAPVPRGFDAWWAKAASRDPAERFQSAKELVEALRAVLAPEHPREGSGPNLEVTNPALSLGVATRREATTLRIPSARTEPGVVSALHPTTGARSGFPRVALLGGIGIGALLGAVLLLMFAIKRLPGSSPLSAESAAPEAAPTAAPDPPPLVSPADSAAQAPSASAAPEAPPAGSAAPVASGDAVPAVSALAPRAPPNRVGSLPFTRPARPIGSMPTPKPKGSQPDRLAF